MTRSTIEIAHFQYFFSGWRDAKLVSIFRRCTLRGYVIIRLDLIWFLLKSVSYQVTYEAPQEEKSLIKKSVNLCRRTPLIKR